MENELTKKHSKDFNSYVLKLGREDQSDFLFTVAKELEISVQSLHNMRYGTGRLSKLKREKIEQIAGTKIFGEE
jgi:hypothetical protein